MDASFRVPHRNMRNPAMNVIDTEFMLQPPSFQDNSINCLTKSNKNPLKVSKLQSEIKLQKVKRKCPSSETDRSEECSVTNRNQRKKRNRAKGSTATNMETNKFSNHSYTKKHEVMSDESLKTNHIASLLTLSNCTGDSSINQGFKKKHIRIALSYL